MRHVQLSRLCPVLIFTAMVFLAGCSTLPQTIPIAVIYDRDLDEFHVEVVEVPEGETPVYPDTLGFVTLVDGERRDGLIPPDRAYGYIHDHASKTWRGPWWVQYKKTEWQIILVPMILPSSQGLDKSVAVKCRVQPKFSPPYQTYLFRIDGAHLSIPRD